MALVRQDVVLSIAVEVADMHFVLTGERIFHPWIQPMAAIVQRNRRGVGEGCSGA